MPQRAWILMAGLDCLPKTSDHRGRPGNVRLLQSQHPVSVCKYLLWNEPFRVFQNQRGGS